MGVFRVYGASRPTIIAVAGKVPGTEDQYADVDCYPKNTTVDDVVILRVEAGQFFANADTIRDRVRTEAGCPAVRAVVIDGEACLFLDLTAVRMLEELAGELRRADVRLVPAHEVGRVRQVIARAEDQQTGRELHRTVTAADEASSRARQPVR
jgi:MFS superfamily sulfate permease-like transporter